MRPLATVVSSVVLALVSTRTEAQDTNPQTYDVGVARLDITPSYPVRLSGFGFRRDESQGITERIWAKAIAIRDGSGKAAVLIAVDNLGIPWSMTQEVTDRLARRAQVLADRIAIT